MEIDPEEHDRLVLLSTIGNRGPSSFVFVPVFELRFAIDDVVAFRKSLCFFSPDEVIFHLGS
jgi:hypothetical protein